MNPTRNSCNGEILFLIIKISKELYLLILSQKHKNDHFFTFLNPTKSTSKKMAILNRRTRGTQQHKQLQAMKHLFKKVKKSVRYRGLLASFCLRNIMNFLFAWFHTWGRYKRWSALHQQI